MYDYLILVFRFISIALYYFAYIAILFNRFKIITILFLIVF